MTVSGNFNMLSEITTGKVVDSRLKKGIYFYDRLPQLNLKTFSGLHSKQKGTISNKDKISRADHRLFG